MADLNEVRFTFDRTGKSADNLVTEELHTVPATGTRIIIANEGLIYTDGFFIRPVASATFLVAGVDFTFVSTDPFITAQTGLETATAIQFLNDTLYGDFFITYQAVGGNEGRSNRLINELQDAIELAKSEGVEWSNVRKKPALYPPEAHDHELVSITGWDAMVRQFDSLRDVLERGQSIGLTGLNLEQQIERQLRIIAEMRADMAAMSAEMHAMRERLKYSVTMCTDLGHFGNPAEHYKEELWVLEPIDFGDMCTENPFDLNNANRDCGGFEDIIVVEELDLGNL